jgi:hypothetical protein
MESLAMEAPHLCLTSLLLSLYYNSLAYTNNVCKLFKLSMPAYGTKVSGTDVIRHVRSDAPKKEVWSVKRYLLLFDEQAYPQRKISHSLTPVPVYLISTGEQL